MPDQRPTRRFQPRTLKPALQKVDALMSPVRTSYLYQSTTRARIETDVICDASPAVSVEQEQLRRLQIASYARKPPALKRTVKKESEFVRLPRARPTDAAMAVPLRLPRLHRVDYRAALKTEANQWTEYLEAQRRQTMQAIHIAAPVKQVKQKTPVEERTRESSTVSLDPSTPRAKSTAISPLLERPERTKEPIEHRRSLDELMGRVGEQLRKATDYKRLDGRPDGITPDAPIALSKQMVYHLQKVIKAHEGANVDMDQWIRQVMFGEGVTPYDIQGGFRIPFRIAGCLKEPEVRKRTKKVAANDTTGSPLNKEEMLKQMAVQYDERDAWDDWRDNESEDESAAKPVKSTNVPLAPAEPVEVVAILALKSKSSEPPLLQTFCAIAGPCFRADSKKNNTALVMETAVVSVKSDLWGVEDFLGSDYAAIEEAPLPGSEAYQVVTRALKLALRHPYLKEPAYREAALLLAELHDVDGMQQCLHYYQDYVSNPKHRQEIRNFILSRQARVSTDALLRLGFICVDAILLALRRLEESSRDLQHFSSVIQQHRGTRAYTDIAEALISQLSNPSYSMRCAAIKLLLVYITATRAQTAEDQTSSRRSSLMSLSPNDEMSQNLTSDTRPGSSSTTSETSYTALRDRILNQIVELMHNDWHPSVRELASNIIHRHQCNDAVIGWIQGCLSAPDSQRRVNALKILQAATTAFRPTAYPSLARCIRDEFDNVRLEACLVACSLGKSMNETIVDALLDRFDDHDWRIRAYAVKALGMSGKAEKKVRDLMLLMLNHELNPAVRAEACIAVRELNLIDDEVKKALKELLDTPHPLVKEHVQEALATIGVHGTTTSRPQSRQQHSIFDSDALENILNLVKRMANKSQVQAEIQDLDDGLEIGNHVHLSLSHDSVSDASISDEAKQNESAEAASSDDGSLDESASLPSASTIASTEAIEMNEKGIPFAV